MLEDGFPASGGAATESACAVSVETGAKAFSPCPICPTDVLIEN